ncbi:MAG: YceI family protein [Pedobacter sp.]|nr:MAG: YceI family protein [Pedobacter sp.]
MKKVLFLVVMCLAGISVHAQDLLISKNAMVSFYSSTVLEDIEAKSTTGTSAINPKTGEMLFKVSNTSFKFPKKLMQEHFNENYMESEKFPFSEFKGKITGAYDVTKNGTYKVIVSGNLNIHGVSKPYSGPAELTVSDGSIAAKASFKVKIADHEIKIPSLVFKNIAEFVEVTIQAIYKH